MADVRAMLDADDAVREGMAMALRIRALLEGVPAKQQGIALGQCAAMWISAHPREERENVFVMWALTVCDIVQLQLRPSWPFPRGSRGH